MASIVSQVDNRNIIDKGTLGKQFSFYNEDVEKNLEKEKEKNPRIDYASVNNPNLFSFGGNI